MTPKINEPIAIVGSGCRFPGEASTPSKLWDLLKAPRDVLRPIPVDRFDPKAFYHPDGLHHGTSNVQDSYTLTEDHREFDAQFFQIKPVEANSIDPQQRLLLETVYESVESAGISMESLQGSQTAVYVGVMCGDYNDLILRDLDTLPTYFATGTHRSIISNRVSYFFDWHGPSMTIDTACSSSLVAMHQAVQALRSGDSRVAVAAGANLLLSCEPYVSESKLKMLSANGQSRMWDESANGYARGDGIAAVVLKTLSAALEDGDHIECIVRETSINQDGRTKGITMPSRTAQAALIRQTYAKAGLDLLKKEDRCQYFEAHGTGTPAGDPIEAGAICNAFFPSENSHPKDDILYVGSIKTVIGHTEGTAGLAAVLKASLALQNGVIPPNLLFNKLNPAVEPFYSNLEIPTVARGWPALPVGVPRRASVNSFGFGGANAHAILESYEPTVATIERKRDIEVPNFMPFTFSAMSEQSLAASLKAYSEYLSVNPSVNLRDLAYTLNSRRSVLPIKTSISATTSEGLSSKIATKLNTPEGKSSALGTRSSSTSTRILGVFTGQGAQWAAMGKELLIGSEYARKTIDKLELSLAQLPSADRPDWSLREELLADGRSSRLSEATIAQPLCTAIQVVLVDHLRSAGIEFKAVVGHSSGEIGAAYAAGYVSAENAIRIAYYRGVHTKHAAGSESEPGAMLAVGTSLEDATAFCELPNFEGRIAVAASNSSSSVTLSGDADAIEEARIVFEEEKKFARTLKVDKAYHSHHMKPCSAPYLDALKVCNIEINKKVEYTPWFSSVFEGELMEATENLKGEYWKDNMASAVLFSQAVSSAVAEEGPFDLVIEVGPHPALKGPASQTIQEVSGDNIPYTGVLSRGKNDIESFADALGFIWAQLGASAVNFKGYDSLASGGAEVKLIKGLPSYAWDHDRIFWHESRTSRAMRSGQYDIHDLLGKRSPDSTDQEIHWKNILSPKEIPWLNGHQLQGQMVFPAAGYVVMAMEAALDIAQDMPIKLIDVLNLAIGRPMTFDSDTAGIETLASIRNIEESQDETTADFTFYAAVGKESTAMALMASGSLKIVLGDSSADSLPSKSAKGTNLLDVGTDRFYNSLAELGYGYTGPFRALSSLQRELNMSRGLLTKPARDQWRGSPPLHPAVLDVAFQAIFLAYHFPGDGRLWSLHVPTSIRRITINPSLVAAIASEEVELPFDSELTENPNVAIDGDVTIFTQDRQHAILQIEGLGAVPFSDQAAADDRILFSEIVWDVATPQGSMIAAIDHELSTLVAQIAHRYSRMKFLEIRAGLNTATASLLSRLGKSFLSYTYTDKSTEHFEAAQKAMQEYSDRMVFKALDIEKDITVQGFVENSYDIIIVTGSLDITANIEELLKNIRQLLKPGGYMLLTATPDKKWNSLLGKTGFSGVDTYTSTVMVSQAVDEAVEFLRRPLSSSMKPEIDDLVIIGGATMTSSKLVSEVTGLLSGFCTNIVQFDRFQDVESAKVPLMATVLILTELDEPVFKSLKSESLEGIKRLFEHPRNVLWIVKGSRGDDPYAMASIGFGRTLTEEMPYVRLQFLDIDVSDRNDPRLIAEQMLIWYSSDVWEKDELHTNMLWSNEPEVSSVNGQFFIPRILPATARNNRYNSSRRVITSQAVPEKSKIVVEVSDSAYTLRQPCSIAKFTSCHSDSETVSVHVSHSLLLSIKIGSCGNLYLVYGTLGKTGRTVLGFAEEQASITYIPENFTVTCNSPAGQEDAFLRSIAAEIFSEEIFADIKSKSTVVVHEPEQFLTPILSQRAAERDIEIIYTTSKQGKDNIGWVSIHPYSSNRVLQALVPKHTSLFVDLSGDSSADSLGARLAACLSPASKKITASSFFEKVAFLAADLTAVQAKRLLNVAISNSLSTGFAHTSNSMISLSALGHSDKKSLFSVINWQQSSPIAVKVEPVDSRSLFKSDRTYLLLGLTGGLGQSLCKWMIEHGARHIVLTSRKPKLDAEWLQRLQMSGATVKVLANDITDRESLRQLYNEISRTMPSIAGVANGAMVLRDGPISNMTIDTMNEVFDCKVKGSIYLDELFPENNLDFFILFSSLAAMNGNSGQSNYTAANMFMASLAAQRRKRGNAASVIDIGAMVGAGYLTRELSIGVAEGLRRDGFMWMGERDFQQAFAEAIIAGRPESGESPELLTGLRIVNEDDELKTKWFDNPRFQNYIRPQQRVDSGTEGSRTNVPVKTLLNQATTAEEILEIVTDAFVLKLQHMLQLESSAAQASIVNLGADELGVDSLVAVEVRSWFMKELLVDMPVLKILGGAVVGDLISFGVEKLPAKLTPNLGKGGEKEKVASAPVPIKQATPSRAMPATANGVADEGQGLAPVVPIKATETEPSSPTTTAPASETSRQQSAENTPPSTSTPSPSLKPEPAHSEPTDTLTIASESSKPLIEIETSTATENIQAEAQPPIPPLVFSRTLPMSPGQSRFWFLKHYLEDQTTFNIAVLIRVKGELRIPDLVKAVEVLGKRHEGLRTAFFVDESEQTTQGILATSNLRLEQKVIDNDNEVMQEFVKMRDHVFDIERGETMRIKLLRKSATENVLLIGYNHINMDGQSFQVLLADLEKAYSQRPMSTKPFQYPDFALKQAKEMEVGAMESELTYWRSEFPDLPPPLPLMSLSRAGSRRALSRYASNRIDVHIEPELTARIRDVCRKQKATPFHFYLAAFRAMLFRFLEVDDVCIGVADAGRGETQVTDTIGIFLNLLPLRFKAKRLQTFSDALKEAKTKAYSAFANSKVPFGVLLEQLDVPRSSLYNPMFQAFVDYRQGVQEKRPFGNCLLEGDTYEVGRTAYDLNLDIIDNPGGDAHIMFMVQESLYSCEDAEIMMKSYVNLLEVFAKNPAVRITRPELFAKSHIEAAINLGRGPNMASTWPETIPHRIDQIIKECPEEIAVKDSFGKVLTYRQLGARINSIAAALLAANVQEGSRVGVFQQPSADWVCSLVAILRVGAIYVPLDPRLGIPRLSTVVKASDPSAIICHALTVDDIVALSSQAKIVNLESIVHVSVATLNLARGDSPAVTLYTSGSTGVPKGIIIKHSSLLNELEASNAQYDTKAQTVLQQCPLSFDLSLEQIFIAITNGGTVFMVSQDQRADPSELGKIIFEEGVTYTVATPSEYLTWLRYCDEHLLRGSSWKHAYAGGEQLPESLKEAFQNLGKPGLKLYNLYGPTEITIACHKTEVEYEIEGDKSRVPAGLPLPNVSTYILDERLKPVPVGMPGEIVIGGAGVAVGYAGNEELNKEKFVTDPFASSEYVAKGWMMMHRTGDRGRMQKDGKLVCEGRITGDTQIKLRGQRIELQDIESTIVKSSNTAIIDAIVSVRGDPEYLVAHVVLSSPSEDKDDWLEKLRITLPLPPYMLPARILTLEKMPFNSHNKRDRLAISKLPLAETSAKPRADVKLTATEAQLKLVWEKVLSKDATNSFSIDADTEFFFVGGNSMLLVRLQSIIREEFDVVMPLVQLFETSTLGSMAARIENTAPVDMIDWVQETLVPDELEWLDDVQHVSGSGKIVLLTGSTGYLGRSLLRRLVEDPEVTRIHCVAVRQTSGSGPRKLAVESPKIVAHEGNLSEPLLGLSQYTFAVLAAEVDVIIHNGAQRSFWEYYQLLRKPNVSSTKELIKLAFPRKIPFHFISSGGVLHLGNDGISSSQVKSVRSFIPPGDGSNGYVASKWASEITLEKAASQLDIPIRIHRTIPAGDAVLSEDNTAIIQDFIHYSLLTKTLPSTAGWNGTFDLVPVADMADQICIAALNNVDTKFIHHPSTIKLDAPATTALIANSQAVKEVGGDEFESISALEWVGRIKLLGFGYMFASQDLTLETGDLDQNEKVMASRR